MSLATSMSKMVVPTAPLEALLMDKTLSSICKEKGSKLSKKVFNMINNQESFDATWFSGKPSQTTIPARAGYCVGFLAIEKLLQKHTIKELLTVKSSETKALILEGLSQ